MLARLRFATILAIIASCCAYGQDKIQNIVGTANNQLKVVNSYPEYWVDGRPFIEHASAFFYHRIPRDRWAPLLMQLKDMGINTIDVYPFWNWHQPQEDALDLDGHTNPRRDLQYLLRVIDSLGLKITFRPGPYYTSEWYNGGYPDWLLRRPEYKMSEQSILEGRYPRLSALQYDKSEQAASEYMQNETHLKYTRQWYKDVLQLAEPMLADRGGPILNIQIDDDQAIGRQNYNGPQFWKYMDLLRGYAKEFTHGAAIPYYINGADMRVNAAANDALPEPIWNTGQDYQMTGEGGYSSLYEAAKNKFFTEILKTEPVTPPGIIEFQAGWFIDEKNTYARSTSPTNTLMASRVMFQNGMKVLNYYPLNDTLYPAGYECQWANWFYGWETAVNYAGEETGRAPYVRRNGRLVAGMGALLGSAHLLADAAMIHPMAAFPQAELTGDETDWIANWSARILLSGIFDHFSFELIDPEHAPAENFQRYRVILFPNPVSGEEEVGKKFTHLAEFSEKSQRAITDYIHAGGTIVVFPSLPGGATFAKLFSVLGESRHVAGDTKVTFNDGSTGVILGSHTVVSPNEDVAKVFARDGEGGVVGVRFSEGKGQVIFFGGDISRWSAPPGTVINFEEGGTPSTEKDYPSEVQSAGRATLSAILKEAGVTRKAYPELKPLGAREPGLYTTELIADSGSLSFERRVAKGGSFGFVGVTNFSADQSISADLAVTNPNAPDLAGASSQRYLRIPRVTVPPRESLLLPVRIPLNHPLLDLGPGLEGDEIVYSTAELTRVTYEKSSLQLEFTAPEDGEIALRLAHRPTSLKIDGKSATIRPGPAAGVYVLPIPRGTAPHFIRRLEASYISPAPDVQIDTSGPWIAGSTRKATVKVRNLTASALAVSLGPGKTELVAPASARALATDVAISQRVPNGASLTIPVHLRENKTGGRKWLRIATVQVHDAFEYSVTSPGGVSFPLREDQAFPVEHPLLISESLPDSAVVRVRIKNWLDREQKISLATEQSGLELTPSSAAITLPAGGEQTIEMHVKPANGSGLYRLRLRLNGQGLEVIENVAIAAVAPHESIAYAYDFDRDGFDDVILENQFVRLFVTPRAGGRSFGFVSKTSNRNAFNSIGSFHDTFATRFEPDDQQGLPDWTRANWLGLYNRPYVFRISSAAGKEASIQLAYDAPDIYPKGVRLTRTLSLKGDQSIVLAEYVVTANGTGKPQAFVLENSFPYRSFDQPSHSQWLTNGQSPVEFQAESKRDIPVEAYRFAVKHRQTGEMLVIMPLTTPKSLELITGKNAAILRTTYPDFERAGAGYSYRVAFYLGSGTTEEIDAQFKSMSAVSNSPASVDASHQKTAP